MTESPPSAPLFERLGGRPRLMHLLWHFYADVRQHREMAPIFAAHIRDWPTHLETIADFWSGATGGPAVPPEHRPARRRKISAGLIRVKARRLPTQ